MIQTAAVPLKLSIIIPVYNEAGTITEIIRAVKLAEYPQSVSKEIIVIDDASSDGTSELLMEYDGDLEIRVLRHEKNMGKTAAVKLGIQYSSGDIILIQDADLEYDPTDYPKLIKPILDGEAHVIYGTRFKEKVQGMTFINRIANRFHTLTVNALFWTHLSDVNTCYKVFKRDVLLGIQITSAGFAFETEITTKLLKRGFAIHEVPIKYVARGRREGKKMTWLKAIHMYCSLFKYAF